MENFERLRLDTLKKIAANKEAYVEQYKSDYSLNLFTLVHFFEHPRIRLLAENENLVVLNDQLCVGTISDFTNFSNALLNDIDELLNIHVVEDIEAYVEQVKKGPRPMSRTDEFVFLFLEVYKWTAKVLEAFEADTKERNNYPVVDAEAALFLFKD